jgi:hypothetical protein
MAAGGAFQEHPVLLELEHGVVAVQAAERLAHPVEHPFAKPFSLRGLSRRRPDFVWFRE